ncbi:hypothetical protein VP01_260g3 [Puccinia sorghi]|uniref:Uncharacterized protein n=1 Tax=Puccinia sorghi TaxID=27349 RepID=A0A0L6V4H5_9BASI|nr:hypothetical protein VP01_260g3 [Puccinia sorghi]
MCGLHRSIFNYFFCCIHTRWFVLETNLANQVLNLYHSEAFSFIMCVCVISLFKLPPPWYVIATHMVAWFLLCYHHMGGEILVDLLMGLFLEGVWQGEGKKVSHHFTLDAVGWKDHYQYKLPPPINNLSTHHFMISITTSHLQAICCSKMAETGWKWGGFAILRVIFPSDASSLVLRFKTEANINIILYASKGRGVVGAPPQSTIGAVRRLHEYSHLVWRSRRKCNLGSSLVKNGGIYLVISLDVRVLESIIDIIRVVFQSLQYHIIFLKYSYIQHHLIQLLHGIHSSTQLTEKFLRRECFFLLSNNWCLFISIPCEYCPLPIYPVVLLYNAGQLLRGYSIAPGCPKISLPSKHAESRYPCETCFFFFFGFDELTSHGVDRAPVTAASQTYTSREHLRNRYNQLLGRSLYRTQTTSADLCPLSFSRVTIFCIAGVWIIKDQWLAWCSADAASDRHLDFFLTDLTESCNSSPVVTLLLSYYVFFFSLLFFSVQQPQLIIRICLHCVSPSCFNLSLSSLPTQLNAYIHPLTSAIPPPVFPLDHFPHSHYKHIHQLIFPFSFSFSATTSN